jgi:uroporphyrinogen decarboxylase
MAMTKAERVMNQFLRKPVDYLPSQITLADRTRDKEILRGMGYAEDASLDEVLENHISFTFVTDDWPLFLHNYDEIMEEGQRKGFMWLDRDAETVFDRWGMGTLRGEDGFFTNYGVFRGDKELNKIAGKYLPDHLTKLFDMPLDKAVEAYEAPDPMTPGNFEYMERDKNGVAGDLCVIPSGYFAIYERAYALFGFEQFMLEIADRPNLTYNIMEKITDYRIKLAQVKADLGYKIAHHGDDLAMEHCGFFSTKMFNEQLLPHFKRLFSEYKRLGMYIFMHSCGHMAEYLPQLIDAGLDGWEPVQPCNDLRTMKREYGKDLVFMGGINEKAMAGMTTDQVKEMTAETIQILGKGGGYMSKSGGSYFANWWNQKGPKFI